MTGDDDENENASPSKKGKGKRGRKPAQKGKNKNQEVENETGKYHHSSKILSHSLVLGTGEDENAENESESPIKKTKGRPARKAGQTNKTGSKKDTDQEAENDTGNSS